MLPHYHVRIHLTRRGILVVLQSKQYVSPSLSPYPVLAPGPVHSALTHYQARPGQHIHFVGIKIMIFSLSVHQSISRSRQNLTFEAEISSGKYRTLSPSAILFQNLTIQQQKYFGKVTLEILANVIPHSICSTFFRTSLSVSMRRWPFWFLQENLFNGGSFLLMSSFSVFQGIMSSHDMSTTMLWQHVLNCNQKL